MAVINAAVNCRTSRVIYCITCKKERCREQYCGKTVSEFKTRMYQHRISVTGTDGKTMPRLDKAIGAHYNGPGHKVSDMSVTIQKSLSSGGEKGALGQNILFNTKHRGVNRNRS